MKRKVSLFLSAVMLASAMNVTGVIGAETIPEIKESASGYYYVEADGRQAALSTHDPRTTWYLRTLTATASWTCMRTGAPAWKTVLRILWSR